MVTGLWGKKVGMTQVFSDNKVAPVTVIDFSHWFVTNVKTQERDGYQAIQVGRVKDKYVQETFSTEWIKKSQQYFSVVREIKIDGELGDIKIGQPADFQTLVAQGDKVDVFGITKGCGFAGVMRRHGFTGGVASHGSMMGKRPGSISFMRSQGRVIKGKKLPGRMGNQKQVMRNLEVVRVEPDAQIVLVKGSVPGKAGSLVFIRKA